MVPTKRCAKIKLRSRLGYNESDSY